MAFPIIVFAEEYSFELPSGLVIIFTTPSGISLADSLKDFEASVHVTLQFNSQQQEAFFLSQRDGGLSLGLTEFFQSFPNGQITTTPLNSCDSWVSTNYMGHMLPIRNTCFFEGCTMQFHPANRARHCKKYHTKAYKAYRDKIEGAEGYKCPLCIIVFYNFRSFFTHWSKSHKKQKLPSET